VAMVAETTCDERGLAWPRNLAPFDVIVMATGKEEALAVEAARIARELSGSGLDVLLDDRKASPGVKFTDAEVLGIPTTVVVGRGLANGIVEVRDRTAGTKDEVAVDDVISRVIADVRGA
jgi:prolyl-tRNA synthetase